MIKLVAFDLDNTLYDYDACNLVAEKALFDEIKALSDVSSEEGRLILKKAKKYVKDNLGDVAASHNRLLYMQNICEQLSVSPFAYSRILYNSYWDNFISGMKLFDYVLPLFQDLIRNDIGIGILTDMTAYIQYRKIDKLEIGEYLSFLVTSEEAGEEKPSSKMFDCMMKKSGCTAEEMIMVGDSEKRDIAGARASGIKAILYEREADIREEVRQIYEADCGCSML